MYIDDEFVKKYDGLVKDRIERSGIRGETFDHIRSKVWERVMASESYDETRGKISTWLWQITRSVISNETKKMSRSQDALDHAALDLDDVHNRIGDEDAGDINDEITRMFDGANLSQRDQSIMRDHHLSGYSSKEIESKYGMEQRAVEQVIYRAMKALRQSVADDA